MERTDQKERSTSRGTYECPCCRGHGIVDDHPRRDEGELGDCEHCEGTGSVDLIRQRQLLAWLESCEPRRAVRPLPDKRRA